MGERYAMLTLIKESYSDYINIKVYFRAKNITGKMHMIKGSICQEDIILLNVSVLSKRVSKYIKQRLILNIRRIRQIHNNS